MPKVLANNCVHLKFFMGHDLVKCREINVAKRKAVSKFTQTKSDKRNSNTILVSEKMQHCSTAALTACVCVSFSWSELCDIPRVCQLTLLTLYPYCTI